MCALSLLAKTSNLGHNVKIIIYTRNICHLINWVCFSISISISASLIWDTAASTPSRHPSCHITAGSDEQPLWASLHYSRKWQRYFIQFRSKSKQLLVHACPMNDETFHSFPPSLPLLFNQFWSVGCMVGSVSVYGMDCCGDGSDDNGGGGGSS